MPRFLPRVILHFPEQCCMSTLVQPTGLQCFNLPVAWAVKFSGALCIGG
jgi:hypothetical protein